MGELRQRLEERLVAGSEQSDPDSGAATEDWRGGGVEGDWVGPNWVGSASHGCGVWTELFLHFRRHPDALASLFEELPRTALSATGGSDIGRGMRTVLSSDAELLARVSVQLRTSSLCCFSSAYGASTASAAHTVPLIDRHRDAWTTQLNQPTVRLRGAVCICR